MDKGQRELQCHACVADIAMNETIMCKACGRAYHYFCLNIPLKQFSTFTVKFLSTWICPECKNVTRRAKSNINTPRHDALHNMNMSCDEHDVSASSCLTPSSPASDIVTMDKIRNLLDQKLQLCMQQTIDSIKTTLRQEIREAVRSEVTSEFEKVKKELSATTDFMCAAQKDLEVKLLESTDKLKVVEEENARLRLDLRNWLYHKIKQPKPSPTEGHSRADTVPHATGITRTIPPPPPAHKTKFM
ncbi:hypothetical protein ACJJTC_005937 [Scirpophaga incertulas]